MKLIIISDYASVNGSKIKNPIYTQFYGSSSFFGILKDFPLSLKKLSIKSKQTN